MPSGRNGTSVGAEPSDVEISGTNAACGGAEETVEESYRSLRSCLLPSNRSRRETGYALPQSVSRRLARERTENFSDPEESAHGTNQAAFDPSTT